MANTPTPDSPGTYLPVPGQSPSTPDSINALKIAAQNLTPSTPGVTSNNIVVNPDHADGKLFISDKDRHKLKDTNISAIINSVLPSSSGTKGPKGDKGDKGDRGPAGTSAAVDYDLLRTIIRSILDEMLDTKSLRFVSPVSNQVYSSKSIVFQVELFDSADGSHPTVSPNWSVSPLGAATISSQGQLTALNVTADTQVTVTASYLAPNGRTYTINTPVTVSALKPLTLNVTGVTTLVLGSTTLYSAVAQYNDGSTKNVSLDSRTTWTLSNTLIGTLTRNSLEVASSTASNLTGTVRAVFVDGATTIQAQVTVNLLAAAPVPKVYALYGVVAAPATGAAYTSYANWGDFIVNSLIQHGTTENSKANGFSTNQGANQYAWYAYPASYGLANFTDTSNSFSGGWDGANRAFPSSTAVGPKTVSVTINGVSTNYYLYRTENAALGAKSWSAS